MKSYETKDVRNVVLIGSPRSGKTTLAEAMLYEGKVIDRRGSVEAKNTVSDNTEFEQTNQKSVYSTPLYAEFKNTKINFVDAPGSDDFIGGAVSAFKVCETGILLVNGQQGVEVGTEIFARHASNYNLPLILAVNHLDHEKANWDHTRETLKEAFGGKLVYVQFPVNPGPDFNAIVDVLKMKMYRFKDANGTCEEVDIPAEYADEAEELRQELMEKAAEGDDALMEKFFEELTLSDEEIHKGLELGLGKGELMPVFCLSAKNDMGVARLMDFIISGTPSPLDTVAKTIEGGQIKCNVSEPVSIFIYKTSVEQHLGEVSYFKVMSGCLKEGADLVNPETGNGERLSAIYAVAGAKKEKVAQINAGDMGCVMKLKAGRTDVTLAQSGVDAIEHIVFPDPKYRCAVKATDKNDEAKVGDALNKLAAQDPTVLVEYSKELRQTMSTTSSSSTSSSMPRRFPTVRPSPRSQRPATVTRSSPAAPASSVRSLCSYALSSKAENSPTSSRSTARTPSSRSRTARNSPSSGAASWSSSTASSAVPSMKALCPQSSRVSTTR